MVFGMEFSFVQSRKQNIQKIITLSLSATLVFNVIIGKSQIMAYVIDVISRQFETIIDFYWLNRSVLFFTFNLLYGFLSPPSFGSVPLHSVSIEAVLHTQRHWQNEAVSQLF